MNMKQSVVFPQQLARPEGIEPCCIMNWSCALDQLGTNAAYLTLIRVGYRLPQLRHDGRTSKKNES